MTKEALDKIERKFTQLEIDKIVYKKLSFLLKNDLKNPSIKRMLREFELYIINKEKDTRTLALASEYAFLKAKLEAIEFTIKKLFRKTGIDKIKRLYQQEMVSRILQSREH